MKYELDQSSEREYEGRTLYRVRRVKDGLIGGWVQSARNLDQVGKCFIYNEAMVMDNAVVTEDSRVFGRATVRDNATVSGNARVSGNAIVSDRATVAGAARVYGNAAVGGRASVLGTAVLRGYDVLTGASIATGVTMPTVDRGPLSSPPSSPPPASPSPLPMPVFPRPMPPCPAPVSAPVPTVDAWHISKPLVVGAFVSGLILLVVSIGSVLRSAPY